MYSTRAFCKKRPEFGHCELQRCNVIMLWCNVTSWCHVHGDGCWQTPVVYDYPFNFKVGVILTSWINVTRWTYHLVYCRCRPVELESPGGKLLPQLWPVSPENKIQKSSRWRDLFQTTVLPGRLQIKYINSFIVSDISVTTKIGKSLTDISDHKHCVQCFLLFYIHLQSQTPVTCAPHCIKDKITWKSNRHGNETNLKKN